MASSITVTSLTVEPLFGADRVTYTISNPHRLGGLAYLDLDAVEIFFSAENDIGTAVKVAELTSSPGVIPPGNHPSGGYYWARARDVTGQHGEFYPPAGQSGSTTARLINPYVLSLPSGAIFQSGLANTGSDHNGRLVTLEFTFPSHFGRIFVSPVALVVGGTAVSYSAWANVETRSTFRLWGAKTTAGNVEWNQFGVHYFAWGF